jgi:hypothetical protein
MKMWASRAWLRAGIAGLAAALIAGCGGSHDSSGTASLRVVNASTGYSLLDLYVDSSQTLSNVAYGSGSSYASLNSGTRTTAFTRSGSGSIVQTQDRTLTADASYTVIAYGWEGSLKTFHISEDEAAPDSGKAKFRTINTAPDAGSLDVYVTGTTDDLADASAVNSAVTGSSLSSYVTLTQGTYRIRVTGAGDKTDLRLDIPSVTLSSQEIASLIVTPTTGGVLVNGIVMQQKGDVTAYSNTSARARLVAATSNASVAATLGSTVLTSGVRSPQVGSYVLVPTGLLPIGVTVNGTALSAGSTTVAPGADLTLLVHGDPASAQVTVLADDNRLPSTLSGSGKTKLRLVHAVAGLDSGLSLVSDFSALVDDVAYGSASSYSTITSGDQSEIDVTSALQTSALYSKTDFSLQADGIYTVWMMGSASAPVGTLLRDR